MQEYPFGAHPTAYAAPLDMLTDVYCLMRWLTDTHGARLDEGLDYLSARRGLTAWPVPFWTAAEKLALGRFETICLMLAAAAELDGAQQSPTFAQAARLLGEGVGADALRASEQSAPLPCLLEIEGQGGLAARFKLRRVVLQLLLGERPCLPGLTFVPAHDPGLPDLFPAQRAAAADLIAWVLAEPERRGAVVLQGKRGAGRRTLARQICASMGMGLVMAEPTGEGQTALAQDAAAVCALTGSVLAVVADGAVDDGFFRALRLRPAVLLLCGEAVKPPEGRVSRVIPLPRLDVPQRKLLWSMQRLDLDEELFARRFRLTAGQIAAVSNGVRASGAQERPEEAALREIKALNEVGGIAKLITPAYTLGDLIADQGTIDALRAVVSTAAHLPWLYEEGGFGPLFPYGRGLGILLCGAPGTGKTMAVYALASELELDVMKVDLSQVEDKYIGETEKRLSQVFEQARSNNCILFFDEADSLFAKRTEVSDSLDRHANTQTAHLLQLMEEYDGLVALATNLADNVDEAFRRRLPFVIEFSKPDAALRTTMWRRFLPPELPREELDFDFLGARFDLTPAVIKWTVLSAAARARAAGAPLGMEHVLAALEAEYRKLGLSMPAQDYYSINL